MHTASQILGNVSMTVAAFYMIAAFYMVATGKERHSNSGSIDMCIMVGSTFAFVALLFYSIA